MARRRCLEAGVEVITGAPVTEVRPGEVHLGERVLPSEATIWTGGPIASPLLAEAGLSPRAGERAPVDDCLAAPGHPGVFIAGDACRTPEPLVLQAYHAIDMGEAAARNVARSLARRRLEVYRPAPKPSLISFGNRTTFLVWGPVVAEGPALGPLKELVYQRVMADLDPRAAWRRGPAAAGRLARAAGRGRGFPLRPSEIARLVRFDVAWAA